MPHPMRYSLYAVLNKGQEVWYGILDRHYPWLAELIMGSGVLVLIFGIIFGVLGDVILRAGKYQSWKCTLLGNGVFSLWIMGYVSRMFLTRDTFFASLVSSYGQEYVDTLMSYTPGWMYPVLFVVTFIGGIWGRFLVKLC